MRDSCFRSFHGQKAQNHDSRASLGWFGALTKALERLAGGVQEPCFRSFHGQNPRVSGRLGGEDLEGSGRGLLETEVFHVESLSAQGPRIPGKCFTAICS